MKRFVSLAFVFVLLVVVSGTALSQGNPTATLNGRVVTEGTPLPGVTVAVRSPSLQGVRTTVTTVNGDYLFTQLPPGDYTVTFEITSFQKVTRDVKLSAAQTSRADAALRLSGVAAEAVVTAEKETISASTVAATTVTQDTIDKLPVARAFQSAVTLTPGVNTSGPSNNITISGGQSYENLFLINGVVVNENLRGQALDLFIEDAVQETTTTTSGISAEYGRFAGGVINVITKSGGNTFNGSFRTSFANDSWQALTKYRDANGSSPENLLDKTIPTYEATLGGPIWKDRIWFFGAGRSQKKEVSANTAAPVSASYVTGTDQQRFEGKLTVTPAQNHSLLLSYQRIDQDDLGNFFTSTPIYDVRSTYDRKTPQQLFAANYAGSLSSSVFVEAQYSLRSFTFSGSGAPSTDLIDGTLLIDNSNGYRYWSPTFCGVCDDEKRDNNDILIKGSYYVSSKSLGTHNLAVGFDRFSDKRFANNHQSGSDYRIYGTGIVARNGEVFPRWTTTATGNSPTYIQWNPILQSSQGNDFVTYSVFLNDTWQLSNRLTFNVGVRWDKNDGTDQAGTKVVNDSKLSPRLGAAWDAFGNGDLIAHASWARYVAGLANNQGDAGSIGGNPATVLFDYRGPQINADPNAANLTTSAEALRILFDWFAANGGTNRPIRGNPTIPGLNPTVAGTLASPNTDEFSLGFSKRFGNRGMVRLDGVYRKSADFYATQIDLGTGTVSGTLAGVTRTFDKQLIVNTDAVDRKYLGLTTQVAYRPLDGLNLQGNWTWSHATGSFDGETTGSGPVSSGILSYPEYIQKSWYAPNGDLAVDRRHKVRLWATYDLPSLFPWLVWSTGLLHSWDTGAPYGAVGTAASGVDTRPYVTNPGYLAPSSSFTYYFTGRDAFNLPSVSHTDLSLNFSLKPWKDVEIFLQPEVINLFNNQALVDIRYVGTGIQTRNNAGTGYAAFNPFTQSAGAPGASGSGATWNYNANFGAATQPLAYQDSRRFRFSVGVRF